MFSSLQLLTPNSHSAHRDGDALSVSWLPLPIFAHSKKLPRWVFTNPLMMEDSSTPCWVKALVYHKRTTSKKRLRESRESMIDHQPIIVHMSSPPSKIDWDQQPHLVARGPTHSHQHISLNEIQKSARKGDGPGKRSGVDKFLTMPSLWINSWSWSRGISFRIWLQNHEISWILWRTILAKWNFKMKWEVDKQDSSTLSRSYCVSLTFHGCHRFWFANISSKPRRYVYYNQTANHGIVTLKIAWFSTIVSVVNQAIQPRNILVWII